MHSSGRHSTLTLLSLRLADRSQDSVPIAVPVQRRLVQDGRTDFDQFHGTLRINSLDRSPAPSASGIPGPL